MDLPEPDDRLNSWKEVAVFLGRTVRTVQRWEKNDGLPLRRGGPGQRGAVVASKREISAWWERRRATLVDGSALEEGSSADVDEPAAAPPAPRRLIRAGWRLGLTVCLAGLAVLIVGAGLPLLRQASGTIDMSPSVGRLLATSTTEGRTLSSVPLGGMPVALALSPSGRLAYVGVHEQRTVLVVDLPSRTVVDRLESIERPRKLAIGPDGTRLLVVGLSELGVLDLRSRALTRFAVESGSVADAYMSRDGRHVWTTLAQAGLRILDLETGRWTRVPAIGCPMYLAAAPRSRRVFLTYQCGGPGGRLGHDAIEILDEGDGSSIMTRAGPPLVGSALAVSPDERHLWIDAGDACVRPYYDQLGCPPGSGPVLHALRAETLQPLLTVRVPGRGFGTTPIFFPDGTRLVLAGTGLKVIDRSLGTVYEASGREPGGGAFTTDGRRFVSLDPLNRALVTYELSPVPDASVFRELSTHWSGDGTGSDIVGGTQPVATDELRFEPGRYGQAFAFDGSSRGVSFGRRLNVDIASSPVTYAAWIRLERGGAARHVLSREGTNGWNWWVTEEGRLAFCIVHPQTDLSCDAGGVVGRTRLLPQRWYHVAALRSSAAVSLFLDGKEDGARAVEEGFQPPDEPGNVPELRLGAGPDGRAPFVGLIDEVLLFGRVLSAAELAQVRRATWLDAR